MILTDDEIAAAHERGRIALKTEPRAKAARYDSGTGNMMVELVRGGSFAFPARLIQGLGDASDAEIAEVVIDGAGFGLHWPCRDVDLTVRGLKNGIYGTRRWMEELVRTGRVAAPAVAAGDDDATAAPPESKE